MAKKRTVQMNGPGGGVKVRRIRFERGREHTTILARALGWFDFSATDSYVFRAQPPGNRRGSNGNYVFTSRNRTTLPDFDRISGAWQLHGWFSGTDAPDNVRAAYFELIELEMRAEHVDVLFDARRDSYDVAKLITECALGVIDAAAERGWI